MNRQEFEHVVRAAAGVTGQKEFIVIGSQSILGKFPDARAPGKPEATRVKVPPVELDGSRPKEMSGKKP